MTLRLLLLTVLLCSIGVATAQNELSTTDRVDIIYGCNQFYAGGYVTVLQNISSQCTGTCGESCRVTLSSFIDVASKCQSVIQSNVQVQTDVSAVFNTYGTCLSDNANNTQLYQNCSNLQSILDLVQSFFTECGFFATTTQQACSATCQSKLMNLLLEVEQCFGVNVNNIPRDAKNTMCSLMLYCTQNPVQQCKVAVRQAVFQLADACVDQCSANCSQGVQAVLQLATNGGCLDFAKTLCLPYQKRCLNCQVNVTQQLNATINICAEANNCSKECSDSIALYTQVAQQCYDGNTTLLSQSVQVAQTMFHNYCTLRDQRACVLRVIQSFIGCEHSCYDNFCHPGCLDALQDFANQLTDCFPNNVSADVIDCANRQGAACKLLNQAVCTLTVAGMTPAQIMASIGIVINTMANVGNITVDRIIIYSVLESQGSSSDSDIAFQILPGGDDDGTGNSTCTSCTSSAQAAQHVIDPSRYKNAMNVQRGNIVLADNPGPQYDGRAQPNTPTPGSPTPVAITPSPVFSGAASTSIGILFIIATALAMLL